MVRATSMWFAHGYAGMALLMGLCAGPAAAQSGLIYSCEDASGRKLTADRPIAACMDREQRILSGSGGERKRIGPKLSEQDAFYLEQRQRADQQLRRQAQESLRKEQALLQRYPRQELHASEYRTSLADVERRIAASIQHMEVLRIERGIQAQEMEFYIRDVTLAPGTLQRLVADTDGMIYQQLRYLQTLRQERNELQQRFFNEQQRLQRYWDDAQLMRDAGAAFGKP